MKIIGVDIGGTKIEAALISNGQTIKQIAAPTPFNASSDAVFVALTNIVDKLFSNEVNGIGIGVPGMVDTTSGDVFDVVNIPAWNAFPLRKKVSGIFKTAVEINNDANCFAIGEKYFGKGKSFKNFSGITIGTGLGGGLILNDRLYAGSFCAAGEFGAMPYLNKTVEAYASGQFFKDRNLNAEKIAQMAIDGNTDAIRLFTELGEHIGKAIAFVLFAFAPEAIILGGSVSKSFNLFEEGLKKSIREFPYKRVADNLVVEVSDLKNSAVLGAASLILDAHN